MKKVKIYTLSTCPWCMKTKMFFNDNNIPFECVEYDLAKDAERELIKKEIIESGCTITFPWVNIGGEVVVGWNPDKFSELLEL